MEKKKQHSLYYSIYLPLELSLEWLSPFLHKTQTWCQCGGLKMLLGLQTIGVSFSNLIEQPQGETMHTNYNQKVGRENSSPNSQVLRNNDGFFFLCALQPPVGKARTPVKGILGLSISSKGVQSEKGRKGREEQRKGGKVEEDVMFFEFLNIIADI